MILFADNDVVQKLAAMDLLEEAVAALDSTSGDVFVLPTARFFFRLNRPGLGRQRWGEAAFGRIARFIDAAQVIGDGPEPADEDALLALAEIDVGERILLAIASRRPDALVVTGDKRSLSALAERQEAREVCGRLAGRLVCLEQVLDRLIERLGFDAVLDRVVPALHCDLAVRAIFGSAYLSEEREVRAGLASYVADLRRAGVPLWEPPGG